MISRNHCSWVVDRTSRSVPLLFSWLSGKKIEVYPCVYDANCLSMTYSLRNLQLTFLADSLISNLFYPKHNSIDSKDREEKLKIGFGPGFFFILTLSWQILLNFYLNFLFESLIFIFNELSLFFIFWCIVSSLELWCGCREFNRNLFACLHLKRRFDLFREKFIFLF